MRAQLARKVLRLDRIVLRWEANYGERVLAEHPKEIWLELLELLMGKTRDRKSREEATGG